MANIYTDIKMFDAESYLANNPDLGEAGYTVENVAEHYVQYGAAEGRAPNAWFDIDFYREQNADLAEVPAGELLFHFAKYGAAEGRSPNPAFGEGQTIAANLFLDYALANKDLQEAFGIAAGATRLTDEQQANVANHFFTYGINESREGGIADVSTDETDAVIKALNAYKATLTAQADADKAEQDVANTAAKNEKVAEVLTATADDKGNFDVDAVNEAVETAVGNAGDGVVATSDSTITGDVSDTKIANAEKVLQAKVDAAKAAVAEEKANAPAVVAIQEQLKAQADAVEAANKVNKAYDGEKAKFDALNKADEFNAATFDLATTEDGEPLHATLTVTAKDAEDNEETSEYIVAVVNGKAVVYVGAEEVTWKNGVPQKEGKDLPVAKPEQLEELDGLDAMLNAFVGVYNNDAALAKTNKAVEAAIVKALQGEGYKLFDEAGGTVAWSKIAFDGGKLGTVKINGEDKQLVIAKSVKVVGVNGEAEVTFESPLGVEIDDDDGSITAEGIFYKPVVQKVDSQGVAEAEDGLVTIVDGKYIGLDLNGAAALEDTDTAAAAEDSATAVGALAKAEKDLKDFQEAVESYNELKALQTELADAAKDVEAAGKAVAEAEKAFADLDINLVKADEDGVASGDAYDEDDAEQLADLFVFSTSLKEVDNFDGDDLFYFGDAAVALIVLDAGFDVAKDKLNGDANVLEIFAVQDGANTVLYVEKEAFAGNSSNAIADNKDLVKIELVGVNAEDLQFDGGFLTLA